MFDPDEEFKKYIKKYGDQKLYFDIDEPMLPIEEIKDHFVAINKFSTLQAISFIYSQLYKYEHTMISEVDNKRERITSFIYNPNTKTAILFLMALNTSKFFSGHFFQRNIHDQFNLFIICSFCQNFFSQKISPKSL